jgi:Fn3 associated
VTKKKDGKSTVVTQLTINNASGGSTIFFTKDGTSNPDPTLSDHATSVYSWPFSLSAPMTIKAVAISAGQVSSGVSTTKIVKGSDGQFVAVSTSSAPASQLSYKSYRFVWHPAYGAPVEWDLPMPPATPSAVTASTILNQSDSTEVTFRNVQVLPNSATLPITFTFDGAVLPAPIFKYDPVAMTVTILITSAMTAKPGHKELLLNGYTLAPGTSTANAVQIELPFDVTRR